jgi:sulfate adenylyltransferase subunit 1
MPVLTRESTVGTLLRFATAGSVDDGKSTLVGRLLHDSKSILADQLEAVTRTSTERGFGGTGGGIDFALLTDGLRAEREQGITIDVAYRYFATAQRSFILADCPGHVQYTRNMVTGATTADAVVMLIDARKGVLEQTRRHLSVVHQLRVPHVIIAVNKIDLLDYSERAFDHVADAVRVVTAQLGLDDVHVLPTSALLGDNIVDRSPNMPWYDGPSLLELLETLPSTDDLESGQEDFRMPVQLVIRPQGALASGIDDPDAFRDYRGYGGQISSGRVSVGDRVTVSHNGLSTVVTGIDFAGSELTTAAAPQSVALRLRDDFDIARGATIAAEGTLPGPTKNVTASLFWLDDRALLPGARVLVKFGTATIQAIVLEITGRRNLDTLELQPADRLDVNDIGQARVRLSAALPVELFAYNRRGGAFLIINPSDGATLAAGTILERNDE